MSQTKKQTPLSHRLAQWLPDFIPPALLSDPGLTITEGATPTFDYDDFWITTQDARGKLIKKKIVDGTSVSLALADKIIWVNYTGVGHGGLNDQPARSITLRTFEFDVSGNLTLEETPNSQHVMQDQIDFLNSYTNSIREMVFGILATYVKQHEFKNSVADLLKVRGSVDVSESVESLGSASLEETFTSDADIDTNASSNYHIHHGCDHHHAHHDDPGYVRVKDQRGSNQIFYDLFDDDVVGQAPAGWTITKENNVTALISSDQAYDGTKSLKLVGDSVHPCSNVILSKAVNMSGTTGNHHGNFSFQYRLLDDIFGHVITIKARASSTDPWTPLFTDNLKKHKNKWKKIEFHVPNSFLTATFEFCIEVQLASADTVLFLDDLQIWADMENNCTVVLNAINCATPPTNALAILKTDDDGVITVSASRDNGVTWTQLVNGDEYTDISGQPTGTQLKLKLQWGGHTRIHYIGALVDVDVV